jgi:hypothetical protein
MTASNGAQFGRDPRVGWRDWLARSHRPSSTPGATPSRSSSLWLMTVGRAARESLHSDSGIAPSGKRCIWCGYSSSCIRWLPTGFPRRRLQAFGLWLVLRPSEKFPRVHCGLAAENDGRTRRYHSIRLNTDGACDDVGAATIGRGYRCGCAPLSIQTCACLPLLRASCPEMQLVMSLSHVIVAVLHGSSAHISRCSLCVMWIVSFCFLSPCLQL